MPPKAQGTGFVVGLPTVSQINPRQFYGVIDLAQRVYSTVDKPDHPYREAMQRLTQARDKFEGDVRELGQIEDALVREVRDTMRTRRDAFKDLTDQDPDDEDPFRLVDHLRDSNNFVYMIFAVLRVIHAAYKALYENASALGKAPAFLLIGEKVELPKTSKQLHTFAMQLQMNEPSVRQFVSHVAALDRSHALVIDACRQVIRLMDAYYGRLLRRHNTDGIKTNDNPVLTDLALSIYENTDSHGEIEDNKEANEISQYTVRKAEMLINSFRINIVGEIIEHRQSLTGFLSDHFQALWSLAKTTRSVVQHDLTVFYQLLPELKPYQIPTDDRFRQALSSFEDLNPLRVVYREPKTMLTQQDREALEHKNKVIGEIVTHIKARNTAQVIVQHILDTKVARHKHQVNENSFYTCRVGSGNPFAGQAPGALEVVPAAKPKVKVEDVRGSGYAEVVDFLTTVQRSVEWHDLLMLTSPSGTADKGNALLIGPMGCGKTEVMRAIASGKGNIGIYAQPSDFLTCWKGESEKNPKRLFEAAVKLQKIGNKQVFILIDEIDAILNDNISSSSFGSTNLTTEFQQLMDGIVHYPHVAVWAATNHPERIPMPMIRRFQKVAVVGELSQEDRVQLLRHFLRNLPWDNGLDQCFEEIAAKLDGAVGDTVRKVCDMVWRKVTTNYLKKLSAPDALKPAIDRIKALKEEDNPSLQIRREFGCYFRVTENDMRESLDWHLNNVAVQAEIGTARRTYENARKFLAGIQKT